MSQRDTAEGWVCWHGTNASRPTTVQAANNREAAEKYAREQRVTAGISVTVVRAKDAVTFVVGIRTLSTITEHQPRGP